MYKHTTRESRRELQHVCAAEQGSLEDGRGSVAAHAAGRVEAVDAEELVDQHAGDAHHGSAAVLALSVELELLDLGVVVAHPRVAANVAGLLVVGRGRQVAREADASLDQDDVEEAKHGGAAVL